MMVGTATSGSTNSSPRLRRCPLTDPERIAAYREIEELAVNTDAAMIGIGKAKAVALGRETIHDDPLNGLVGGWPFLESAWIEQG